MYERTQQCIAEEIENKDPNANAACKAECLAITKRADLILNKYGDERASARTASRQCSGFTDGQCKNHFLGYFPACWCVGKDFSQLSFLCRRLALEWFRIYLNAINQAADVYDNSIKPQLDKWRPDLRTGLARWESAKMNAATVYESSIKPLLPSSEGGKPNQMNLRPFSDIQDEIDIYYYEQIQKEAENPELDFETPPLPSSLKGYGEVVMMNLRSPSPSEDAQKEIDELYMEKIRKALKTPE